MAGGGELPGRAARAHWRAATFLRALLPPVPRAAMYMPLGGAAQRRGCGVEAAVGVFVAPRRVPAGVGVCLDCSCRPCPGAVLAIGACGRRRAARAGIRHGAPYAYGRAWPFVEPGMYGDCAWQWQGALPWAHGHFYAPPYVVAPAAFGAYGRAVSFPLAGVYSQGVAPGACRLHGGAPAGVAGGCGRGALCCLHILHGRFPCFARVLAAGARALMLARRLSRHFCA